MDADPLHFLSTARSLSKKDDILVTLTFAQSCDAKIAGKNGQQLLLSGKESMLMTHRSQSSYLSCCTRSELESYWQDAITTRWYSCGYRDNIE